MKSKSFTKGGLVPLPKPTGKGIGDTEYILRPGTYMPKNTIDNIGSACLTALNNTPKAEIIVCTKDKLPDAGKLVSTDDSEKRGLEKSGFKIVCDCGKLRQYMFFEKQFDVLPCPNCKRLGMSTKIAEE